MLEKQEEKVKEEVEGEEEDQSEESDSDAQVLHIGSFLFQVAAVHHDHLDSPGDLLFGAETLQRNHLFYPQDLFPFGKGSFDFYHCALMKNFDPSSLLRQHIFFPLSCSRLPFR